MDNRKYNYYESLRKEVKNNGSNALTNRRNQAARARREGNIKDAMAAEEDIVTMLEIAERESVKL